jgi:hypothetical protein
MRDFHMPNRQYGKLENKGYEMCCVGLWYAVYIVTEDIMEGLGGGGGSGCGRKHNFSLPGAAFRLL